MPGPPQRQHLRRRPRSHQAPCCEDSSMWAIQQMAAIIVRYLFILSPLCPDLCLFQDCSKNKATYFQGPSVLLWGGLWINEFVIYSCNKAWKSIILRRNVESLDNGDYVCWMEDIVVPTIGLHPFPHLSLPSLELYHSSVFLTAPQQDPRHFNSMCACVLLFWCTFRPHVGGIQLVVWMMDDKSHSNRKIAYMP